MKMQKNVIPIVMICDKNFVMQTCVALKSLYLNKKESTVYNVFVVMANGDDEDIKLLQKVSHEDFNVEVLKASLDKYEGIRQLAHVPLASLLKFDICDLVPQYEKILYLDGDIIVREDLYELYHTELDDNYVAGVPHSFGIVTGEKKLNGGVLLFNAAKIRKQKLRDSFISTRYSLGDRKSMDQETFHMVFGNKKVFLAPKYNVMLDKIEYEKKYYTMREYNDFFDTSYGSRKEIIDTAAIIHYTGSIKPWKYQFAPCGEEWSRYYKAVFADPSRLKLKSKREFYGELVKKDGWRSMYWGIKDKILGYLGEYLHFFPDRSHEEWN